MGRNKPQPACVVWTPPDAPIPQALDRVLTKRGLRPDHARSAYETLAALVAAQRAGTRSAVILAGVHDTARLLTAVERFAPDAVVWIFDEAANPPLFPLVSSSEPSKETTAGPALQAHPIAEPKPHPPAASKSPPGRVVTRPTTLKIAPQSADPTNGVSRVIGRENRPQTISARDVLEDAELEALLAGETASEPRAKGRPS
ncbi:MAG: hypothetical protein D6692_04170 [Planctomycetota bacterium]|nr:MAG: hypothetical protein D6692_04170 [Planctomycetota bacterium]